MWTVNEKIRQLNLSEKVLLCSGGSSWSTHAIPEMDIPEVVMTDGTYGVRYVKPGEACIDGVEAMAVTDLNLDSGSEHLDKYYRATCFPSPSAFACSWDRVLIHHMASQIGAECRALGVDLLLAPAINIRRDPRGGRSFEYYSEDPFLTSELAGAFIEGLRERGVGACLKHYACNNSEYRRTLMDSVVDDCALREIYLYAFERIVKKHSPTAVMSSYNRLNGEHVSQSRRMLTELLRNEWSFEGVVISDWGGIKDRLAALTAGGDFEMPMNAAFNRLIERAVEKGELSEAELDKAVSRILRFIEHSIKERKKAPGDGSPEIGHRLAVEVAEKSCVLLKNDGGVLPLNSEGMRKLVVVGSIAKKPRYQGGGCAVINPTSVSIPLEEIRARAHCPVVYCEGFCSDDEIDENLLMELSGAAQDADAVIVFAGLGLRDDTEGSNRTTLSLEPAHLKVIRAAAAVNPQLVVVLSNGEAVLTGEFSGGVPAILEGFFSGQGGGEAIARILFGEVNPSGKLTVTFPARESDLPGFLTFPGEFEKHVYTEGRFTGYRYYDKKKIMPEYPFGHGLSYTSFAYEDLRLEVKYGVLTASFTLRNTGCQAGAEIAQLYIHPLEGGALIPLRVLKGFEKMELNPMEAAPATISCEITDAFSFYDGNVRGLVVRSGGYAVEIGASSRDIRLTGRVRVEAPEIVPPITDDSLHVDIFRHPLARKRYLEYLYEIGAINDLIQEDTAVRSLSNMFWGLHRALIALKLANPAIRVDLEELRHVLGEINQELIEKARSGISIRLEDSP